VADREAKLRILTELVGMDKAAEIAAKFNLELKEGGDAAEKTATALAAAATATDRLDVSQSEAAGSASKEAIALDEVGTSATLAGERASSAASETAEALDDAAVAAERERAAIERVGAEAGQSGAEATAAIEKVTAAEQEAAAEAAKLSSNLDKTGDEGAKAAADIAKRFTDAGEAIRKSGLSLEVQRAGMQALVADANDATVAFIKQGAEGKEGADATGNALIKLKANLADVNSELTKEIEKFRTVGAVGSSGISEITSSTLTFESVAAGATDRVNAAWQTLNNEFRITPRQLGVTGQAVELLKIELLDMSARGVAATAEQIAVVERLESEYLQLTATANKLTNAVKDNAVRLKETGNQVQGVASGFQQLASMFGPTGAKIGMLVGNLGQAAGAAENMKDSIAAMDLNKLGGGAAKGGVQLAALAAALLAGVYAGKQFSDQNEENSQAMDTFTREVKKLVTVPLGDWVDGANLSLQRWFADPSLDGLLKFLSGYQLLAQDTGTAIRLQTAAMRDGLSETQAAALAAKGGAEAWKFYEQSVKGGAIGHELWAQALRESQGDGEKFLTFMRDHAKEMENAVRLQGVSAEARKKEIAGAADLAAALTDLKNVLPNSKGNADTLNALADAIDKAAGEVKNLTQAERERLTTITDAIRKGNDLTETEIRKTQALLNSARASKEAGVSMKALADAQAEYNRVQSQGRDILTQNAVAVAQARSDLEKFEIANNGTTTSITQLVAEIERYIALGPAYAKETGVLSDALTTVLDRTTRLEPAQRANIEAYAELAAKSGELTAREKEYAEELAKAIETGSKYRVMLKERATAVSDLAATLALIDAQEKQSDAERALRADAVRQEIDLIREAREEIERRTGATKDQTTENKYAGASADYLRMKEQQLQEELSNSLTSWSANSDAKRRDAEEGQKVIDTYRQQVESVNTVKTATGEMHAVVENGRVVWTNLKEDADKVTGATLKVQTTTESLGRTLDGLRDHQALFSATASGLVGDADAIEAAMKRAANSIRELNDEAAKAAGYTEVSAGGQ
jgi:hypothetical protein